MKEEDSTAQGREHSKRGVWMQEGSGFSHLQEPLLRTGAHGEGHTASCAVSQLLPPQP